MYCCACYCVFEQIMIVCTQINILEYDEGDDYMDFLLIAFIFIVATVVVILIAKGTASHKFKCKHCAKEFRVTWSKVVITEHSGNEYKLVCPCCKTKDWCTEQPKNT